MAANADRLRIHHESKFIECLQKEEGIISTRSSWKQRKERSIPKKNDPLRKMHARTALPSISDDLAKRVAAHSRLAELSRDRKFNGLFESVITGKAFVRDLENSLQITDSADRGRKVKQYTDWNDSVFSTIQGRIAQEIDALDSKELNARKRQHFEDYLNVTNHKAAFLDNIIESEYDPLVANREGIRVSTRDIADPLAPRKSNVLKMVLPPSQQQPEGRETFPTAMWATGKVEDTPHGIFARAAANRRAGDNESIGTSKKSNIHFDHYDFEVGLESVKREMPRGKRTFDRPPTSTSYE